MKDDPVRWGMMSERWNGLSDESKEADKAHYRMMDLFALERQRPVDRSALRSVHG